MKPSTLSSPGIAAGPLGLSTLSLKRLIEWGDQYEIGQPELDAQHAEIFGIALEVADLWERRADLQRLKDIAGKLARVLAAHFAFEEQLFAGTDYARSEEHRDEHRTMLAELQVLRARLGAMPPGRVRTEPGFLLLSYVLGLTVGHLSHCDMDARAARSAPAS